MGYSTQRVLKDSNLNLNDNVLAIDPVGYLEFMYLLKNSKYCISDSGTVVEEACILGIPSIQMRYSTERPEVYEVNSSIKFDPTSKKYDFNIVHESAENLIGKTWNHPFGNGDSSEIIVNDLINLSKQNSFSKHGKEDYDFDISRSFLK